MSFERELPTYEEQKALLIHEEGKFVVIQGERIAGTYESYDLALSEGLHRFGRAGFLIKKIESNESVAYISRDFRPCRKSSAL